MIKAVTRRVVFIVYEDFQILDLTGPLEVFSMANRVVGSRPAPYRTATVSPGGGTVRASCGLTVTSEAAIANVRGGVDTLVVCGGLGSRQAVADRRLIARIVTLAGRSRRVSSVCTGALLLAEAGLLDGRRATTHWASCRRLARTYPDVAVDPAPIFVRDGDVWTSAGVTAGMDLALAMVENDLGAEVARTIARWLVLFVQRPGGQAQFSAQLAAQRPERPALRDLEGWIVEHPAEDLAVPILARRAGMSTRNFARAFRAEFGMTPASYVESVRVEALRRLLETTATGVAELARVTGFGTVETMNRAFRRSVGVTPTDYRRRFGARASA